MHELNANLFPEARTFSVSALPDVLSHSQCAVFGTRRSHDSSGRSFWFWLFTVHSGTFHPHVIIQNGALMTPLTMTAVAIYLAYHGLGSMPTAFRALSHQILAAAQRDGYILTP